MRGSMTLFWAFVGVCLCLAIKYTECIYDGADAELGSFPYIVSIQEYGTEEHQCGGTIINERFIITSAACLEIFRTDDDDDDGDDHIWKPIDLIAIAGIVSLTDASATVLGIEEIIEHPEFDPNSMVHDLAMVRTTDAIEFTEFIRPVNLPSSRDQPYSRAGMDVTVAGWGYRNEVFPSYVLYRTASSTHHFPSNR